MYLKSVKRTSEAYLRFNQTSMVEHPSKIVNGDSYFPLINFRILFYNILISFYPLGACVSSTYVCVSGYEMLVFQKFLRTD